MVKALRYVKLQKENLDEFLERCKELGELHGPVKVSENQHSYEKVENPEEMDLNFNRTMIPPTKYTLPPKQKMFTFDADGYKEELNINQIVLFGVHACDINAMRILDQTYVEGSYPDKYYQKAKENLFIIGHSCMPDEYCFCKSWDSEFAYEGFDLFLHELEGRYLIRVGSAQGNDLIDNNLDILDEDVDEKDINELKAFQREKGNSFERSINKGGLKDLMDMSFDSNVWEKHSEDCFTCGSCTLVCPTCICYDLQDKANPDGSGSRERTWTSCFYRRHGLVSGEHNFRPSKLDRFRHRYNCKNYYSDEDLNCTGCGRCIEFCQANIDHVEVLNDLVSSKSVDTQFEMHPKENIRE